LAIGHPSHSPIGLNVTKVHRGKELGYDLLVPILSEPHKCLDPLPLTVANDFIKYRVAFSSHVLPIIGVAKGYARWALAYPKFQPRCSTVYIS
jgi:hypothetical protein